MLIHSEFFSPMLQLQLTVKKTLLVAYSNSNTERNHRFKIEIEMK